MSKRVHRDFIEIAGGLSPTLARAIHETGPVQLKRRNETPIAELLCRAVAGQQLSGKAARTIWNRVVDSCNGDPLTEHLAEVDPQVLRDCGLSRSKAKAMKAITEASASGQLDVELLGKLDHADRSQRLTEIWGVGQWTADMIGISYFGDKDVWPAGDITVCKTLERLTSRRRKTQRTAAHFAPHRTYLALYMWKIADASPNAQPDA